MLTKRPKNHEFTTYNASYSGEGLDLESREILKDFNIQKKCANQWLSAEGIPLLLRFKPTGKSNGLMSHMELHLCYVLPNHALTTVAQLPLSWNQIKLMTHWKDIARRGLKLLDKSNKQESILELARTIEVEMAYEMAY